MVADRQGLVRRGEQLTARGRLLAGTSGFAYRAWIGEFYPPGTRSDGMLGYYADRFGAVEVNATFYRLPTAATLDQWIERTPAGFVFTFKAPRRITHHARLVDVGETLEVFIKRLSRLGDRLGPILFQCPPNLGCDLERLESFLRLLPPGDFAMEFRHDSWENAEVRDLLARSGVALCISDRDGVPARRVDRAESDRFVYLRLRRSDYSPAELTGWAGQLKSVLDAGADVYAFLKHEDTAAGTRWAEELRRALSAPGWPSSQTGGEVGAGTSDQP
ncbi:MAG: DUF72 domain-containing protein [Acidimicrobiia bacterium]